MSEALPRQGLLILISAPSGAGKTSLVNAALAGDARLVVSVSHTTRPMRDGEVDGENYHFVSADVFERMIEEDAFLEHARVFGNYYGTSKQEVDRLRDQDKDVILEIDWQGAEQVRDLEPDALSIFIMPPGEQALRERLESRGKDDAPTIERRLSEARLDMSKAVSYDSVVVNDQFETAVADLLTVIRAARLGSAFQRQHNPRVAELIDPR